MSTARSAPSLGVSSSTSEATIVACDAALLALVMVLPIHVECSIRDNEVAVHASLVAVDHRLAIGRISMSTCEIVIFLYWCLELVPAMLADASFLSLLCAFVPSIGVDATCQRIPEPLVSEDGRLFSKCTAAVRTAPLHVDGTRACSDGGPPRRRPTSPVGTIARVLLLGCPVLVEVLYRVKDSEETFSIAALMLERGHSGLWRVCTHTQADTRVSRLHSTVDFCETGIERVCLGCAV